jgi:hypothetical protein
MAGKATPWRCGYCLRTARKCRRRGISPACDGCRAFLAERGKKFCRGCGQAKPLALFDRVGRGEQRRSICQTCRLPATREARREYIRRWREEKRTYYVAYTKAWRARNRERVRQHARNAYVSRKMRESSRLRLQGGAP